LAVTIFKATRADYYPQPFRDEPTLDEYGVWQVSPQATSIDVVQGERVDLDVLESMLSDIKKPRGRRAEQASTVPDPVEIDPHSLERRSGDDLVFSAEA
jgi:hypothetical protein